MSESESNQPARISDFWFPDEVWFRNHIATSAPWSDVGILAEVPESARGSYGAEMSTAAQVDGVRYKTGQLVVVETKEEMKLLLASIPQPSALIFPWFDRIVPVSLVIPHTRQIDGEAYRSNLKSQIAKSFLITAGLVGVAWVFPIYLMLALLGGVIFGLFPLVEASFAWFRRIEKLSVDELNQRLVNGELFRLWVLSKKTTGLKVALGILVAIFLGQMAVGLRSSARAAALLHEEVLTQGEWWRVITAGLMHGDPVHILFNGMALYNLGRVLCALVSSSLLSLVFMVSVVTGSLASLYMRAPSEIPSVGASGGILGCLGFLLVVVCKFQKELPEGLRSSLIQSTVVLAVFGLLGNQFIDNAAHAGGMAGGAILALVFYPRLRLGGEEEPVFWKGLGMMSLLVLGAGVCKVVQELWALNA